MAFYSHGQLTPEIRTTIHKLNNLLTTILVKSETLLSEPLEPRITEKVETIFETADQASRELKGCRRLLAPDSFFESGVRVE